MATRVTQQNPDPNLMRNIRRARTGQQRAQYGRALVAGASLAGTLGMVALVGYQDAQASADTQTPPPVVVANTPSSSPGIDLSGLAALPGALQSWWDSMAQSMQVQTETGFPDPITRTRSSR